MGLDQYFSITTNQWRPQDLKKTSRLVGKCLPIASFRKHSELHGYMELLADRQGLIDLLEQDQTFDYDRFEQAVNVAVNQLSDQLEKGITSGQHLVATPYGNVTLEISGVKETEMDGKDAKHIQLGIIYPKKGRQGRFSEGYVRLNQDDVVELIQLIEKYFNGEHTFPPCKGFFFGESEPEDWKNTHEFLSHMLAGLNWDEHYLVYSCEW